MTDTRLTFKEMCTRFDVTPRTLRYYEYIELLAPEKEGRARFYGPREVARMKLILRGRRFGFSLEEIRQWLLIYGKTCTPPSPTCRLCAKPPCRNWTGWTATDPDQSSRRSSPIPDNSRQIRPAPERSR
jgi:DNA-binding transcriptional MerR regulator